MKIVRGFGRFWYDFLIGDDPKIAVAVAITLAVGTVLVGVAGVPAVVACPVIALLLIVAFSVSVRLDTRRSKLP